MRQMAVSPERINLRFRDFADPLWLRREPASSILPERLHHYLAGYDGQRACPRYDEGMPLRSAGKEQLTFCHMITPYQIVRCVRRTVDAEALVRFENHLY